jgi:hypothetical protein
MTDKQTTRHAYHPSELPDHLKQAIRDAKMTSMPLWVCQRCGYMIDKCGCPEGYLWPEAINGK